MSQMDTVNSMDPGAPDPIGTLKEIKKLKLSPLKYATCSLPSRRNRGCAHFDHPVYGPCPIRALLARRGRPGPERVAFVQVKSATNWKQDATDCYTYQTVIAHRDRRMGVARILGIGGDVEIKRRSTVPKPGNPNVGKVMLIPEKIQPFPRPNESLATMMDTMGLAKEILQQTENDDLKTMMGLGPEAPEDVIPPTVGDGEDALLEDDEIDDDNDGLDSDDDEAALGEDALLDDEPATLKQATRGRRKKGDDGE